MDFTSPPVTVQPLPLIDSCILQHSPDPGLQSAYRLVLDAESAAVATQDEQRLRNARIVGHLILHLYKYRQILGNAAYSHLKAEVTSKSSTADDPNDVVNGVGGYYCERLLRVCKYKSSCYELCNDMLSGSSAD